MSSLISLFLATFLFLFHSSASIVCNCFGKQCLNSIRCESGNHCIIEHYHNEFQIAKCGYEHIEKDHCFYSNTPNHHLPSLIPSSRLGYPRRVCRCTTDFCNSAELLSKFDSLVTPMPRFQAESEWKASVQGELRTIRYHLEMSKMTMISTRSLLNCILAFVIFSFVLVVLLTSCITRMFRKIRLNQSLCSEQMAARIVQRHCPQPTVPAYSINPPSYATLTT